MVCGLHKQFQRIYNTCLLNVNVLLTGDVHGVVAFNIKIGSNMDLEQYKKDAIRTESQIEQVQIDGRMLINVLAMFISAGQMLDQVKKQVFYGKDYNPDEFNHAYLTVRDAIGEISGVPLSGDLPKDSFDIDPRVFHSIIGIATESTELCEALYDVLLHKNDLDVVNLLEENGDIHWYQAIMMDALGGDWESIFNTNIEKLRARYPEKFTSDKAINRDLDAEREILEK